VRVIAATSKDLEKAIEQGEFRQELFFRLNVIRIEIPPLHERQEDIIPLAEYFIAGRVNKISQQATKLLQAYTWPGNVRELKNSIERAIILGDGRMIYPEDLPYQIRKGSAMMPAFLEPLEQIEKDHIIRVLRFSNWHKIKAAEILGITRPTLDSKIEKYQITREET
jgi:transcriptional regulator with PAS, ATPase and Fis domain